jgi:hypothetical protein
MSGAPSARIAFDVGAIGAGRPNAIRLGATGIERDPRGR